MCVERIQKIHCGALFYSLLQNERIEMEEEEERDEVS
jgi:hypothetical protein